MIPSSFLDRTVRTNLYSSLLSHYVENFVRLCDNNIEYVTLCNDQA